MDLCSERGLLGTMMLRDLLSLTRTTPETLGECMVSFALSHSVAQVCWLWIRAHVGLRGAVAVFCLLCVVGHICSRFFFGAFSVARDTESSLGAGGRLETSGLRPRRV